MRAFVAWADESELDEVDLWRRDFRAPLPEASDDDDELLGDLLRRDFLWVLLLASEDFRALLRCLSDSEEEEDR